MPHLLPALFLGLLSLLWFSCLSPAVHAQHPVVAGFERFFAVENADAAAGGRLLLGELNCVACHRAQAPLAEHLLVKHAPVLTDVGARVRPGAMRNMIANPQKTKPGTTMPDVLAHLPESKKTEAVEALVHFLATTGSVHDTAPDQAAANRGEVAFHRLGCVACHDPRENGQPPETPLATSVPLGNPHAKFTIGSLTTFLMDPLKARPSGRMPALGLTRAEASDLAHFFLKDIDVPANVSFQYYEGSWNKLPDFSKLQPIAMGGTASIDVAVARRRDQFGLRFEGFLHVAQPGEYTFFLGSDDGSRLRVDEKVVVDNDGVHGYTEKQGKVSLSAGPHAVVVEYFEQAGEEVIKAEFQGPGTPRQSIAGQMTVPLERPKPRAEFKPLPELAARGRELFSTLGCAACHEFKEQGQRIGSQVAAKPLAEVKSGGCLEESPAGKAPAYALSRIQRQALVAALGEATKLPPARGAAELVQHTMLAFNCYACHVRGKLGGVEEARYELFQSTTPEMGDEGKIPPHLDGVGDKLTSAALRTIFEKGAKDRPYMHARMPRFGMENVGQLVAALETVDLHRTPLPEIVIDAPPNRVKADGRLLTGSKGLSCIKCHNFAGHKGTGVQSLDLIQMPQRLRPDWFVRYLLNPNEYRPGTRMPQPWPNGKSLLPNILNGNTEHQIWAIWQYLSDGAKATPPLGLEATTNELIVLNEAVIYRNFIEGGGPRGIGVGYPQKVNITFDAEDLRLALIWQGAFLDAGLHWNGRGAGFTKPLGDNVIKLPDGVAFACLPDSQAPWPKQSARELGCQFRGYRLAGEERRPTFHYSVAGVDVFDEFQGVAAAQAAPSLRRTLTIRGQPQGNLYYRAAAGNKIVAAKDGAFVVNDVLHVRLSGAPAQVRKADGGEELLVPLAVEDGESKILQEYVW